MAGSTLPARRQRRYWQAGFYLLFLLAPALDLLRFDLYEAQLWFLGMRWSLGIDAALRDGAPGQAAWSVLWRGIVPALLLVAGFFAVAWRYGRMYCGWLCPHFSMVEGLNALMHRASGKFSFWDEAPTPRHGRTARRRWWPVFALACLAGGFVWALTLLTYLLDPRMIWHNLLHASLTPNQWRFLLIGTAIFSAEFALARHLFCRFGCALGLFQSLVWMGNPRGMVVAFDRARAPECRDCTPPAGDACDAGCPMRLNPRKIKRHMFTCVQCGACLDACDQSHQVRSRPASLEWKVGLDAVRETLRQQREARRP